METNRLTVAAILATLISLLTLGAVLLLADDENTITSFEDCIMAGYPVQESYPRQCVMPDGQTFREPLPEL